MDDAFLVRGLERVGNLSGDVQSLVERQSDPRRRSASVAFDELHHEVVRPTS